MILTEKEKEELSKSLEQSRKEFKEKARKDERTIWYIARSEGCLMATDYWCARYIELPISIRYDTIYHVINWWSYRNFGRFLTYRKSYFNKGK